MNSNSRKTQLMEYIKMLSSEAVNLLLTIVLGMIDVENTVVSACPSCAGKHIVHNGKTCGKQRFLCRSCKRTFVTTTHTILSMSHSPASIWKEVVADTLMGRAIDYTAERIGLSHPCVFHMRHKILLGFEKLIEADPVILTQVAELDETFVLECFKGKKLPPPRLSENSIWIICFIHLQPINSSLYGIKCSYDFTFGGKTGLLFPVLIVFGQSPPKSDAPPASMVQKHRNGEFPMSISASIRVSSARGGQSPKRQTQRSPTVVNWLRYIRVILELAAL